MSEAQSPAEAIAAWLVAQATHPEAPVDAARVAEWVAHIPLVVCEANACSLTVTACATRWRRANAAVDIAPGEETSMGPCVGCPDGAAREADGAAGPRITTGLGAGQRWSSPATRAARRKRIVAAGVMPVDSREAPLVEVRDAEMEARAEARRQRKNAARGADRARMDGRG